MDVRATPAGPSQRTPFLLPLVRRWPHSHTRLRTNTYSLVTDEFLVCIGGDRWRRQAPGREGRGKHSSPREAAARAAARGMPRQLGRGGEVSARRGARGRRGGRQKRHEVSALGRPKEQAGGDSRVAQARVGAWGFRGQPYPVRSKQIVREVRRIRVVEIFPTRITGAS